MLEKTGAFNKAVAVIPSTKLQEGDILVTRSKGHTVIVIEQNQRISQPINLIKLKQKNQRKIPNLVATRIEPKERSKTILIELPKAE